MARFFGLDVIDAIETRLKDTTNGVNAQIDTINASRNQGAPAVTDFLKGNPEKQYPEGYIDLKDTTTEEMTLSGDIDQQREIFPGEITIMNKDNNTNMKVWAEIYIEALHKCLHGYSIAGITSIIVTGTIREELYDTTKNNYILCGVKVDITVN